MQENFLKKAYIFWLIPVFLLSLWYFKEIIIPFLAGFIIGSAIQSLSFYLSHKIKINYYLAVIFIYSLFLFLISITLYLIFQVFLQEIPTLLEKFNSVLAKIKFSDSFSGKINLNDYFGKIFSFSDYFFYLLNFISIFFGSFISFILILVISFYVSFFKNIPENILLFFNVENKYLKIIHFIRRKIAFWFVGLIFLMLFIGISTYIFTAFVLKLKYALVISLAAGIFEALPILGPIITLVLALFVVFLENPSYILPTIIFFISIQQLENHLLVPLVMRKAISLNPILIILGILIGSKIGGVLGIIIVTPILGSIIETIKLLKIDKKFYNNKM